VKAPGTNKPLQDRLKDGFAGWPRRERKTQKPKEASDLRNQAPIWSIETGNHKRVFKVLWAL
jgi:hypothetical protein